MLAAAAGAAPEECCGVLLGRGEIEIAVPARNIASDPHSRFEIDPQALIDAHRSARAGGLPLIGYFHSHPSGPAAPSAIDRELAAHDEKVWAIVGEDGVTFWRDEEAGFAPLPYVIAEG